MSGPSDGEALTISPDRSVSYVSFEGSGGVHRFDGILARDTGYVDSISSAINGDCGWGNEQYEALELLDDRTILGICESNGKGRIVRLDSGALIRAFTYPTDRLQVSDAARLGAGHGLLVLERLYTGGQWGKMVKVRVQHISESDLFAGRITPLLLLELNPSRDNADNFEGIAAHEMSDGVRIWLMSDNNFDARGQRTLLYEFWLPFASLPSSHPLAPAPPWQPPPVLPPGPPLPSIPPPAPVSPSPSTPSLPLPPGLSLPPGLPLPSLPPSYPLPSTLASGSGADVGYAFCGGVPGLLLAAIGGMLLLLATIVDRGRRKCLPPRRESAAVREIDIAGLD